MVARALLNQRTPKLSILLIINQNDMNRENQMRKDGADVLSSILFLYENHAIVAWFREALAVSNKKLLM